ncbi:MAG: HAMP domain-containing sensor histidine kinase [Acidobacteriota bacterium]
MALNLRKWLKRPESRIILFLAFLLLAVNAVGMWGIIYSGREAQDAAIRDLQLQTVAAARTLEAILASARADCMFLSQSPQLTEFRAALSNDDPLNQRWTRINLESTVTLFLKSHPEVESVVLNEDGQPPFLWVGRREGAPVPLKAKDWQAPAASAAANGRLYGRWPLGDENSGAWMQAELSSEAILGQMGSSSDYELEFRPVDSVRSDTNDADEFRAMEAVRDPGWDPPVDWTLVRSERRVSLMESLSRLTARYRITLAVNLLLMGLAALLGLVSYHQVRKRVVLETENLQQSRIRELERQLMHSERLAGIGRLAAGLAHEINNPLEGMKNYLSLLDEDVRAGRLDTAHDFIRRIRSGVDRAAGVTRRALTFAEPGQRPSTRVDLSRIVADTVDFVRGNPLFRGIEIPMTGFDTEISVRGNPVTLSQALLNLLMNAAEIMQGAGTIEVNGQVADGFAVVSVADNGPGIDEEIQEHIFEPFCSGRDSTGLGLSVCRTILLQHDGDISAGNRSGGGAVFTFRVPLWTSTDSEEEGPPKVRERMKGSGEKVGRGAA